MCQCTPGIRTPFCGEGDCQWPEQETVSDLGINEKDVIEWLLDGETGLSSKNIIRFLMTNKNDGSHPHDPADLRRCVLLLDKSSKIRAAFLHRMPRASTVWKELVDIWPLLEQTLKYEMKSGNSAPKTYDLMKEAILRGSIAGGVKGK